MKMWNPNPEHLICRDLQHAWKPQTAKRVTSGYLRTLICTRCSSVKEQTLDEWGYITSSRMSYPEGYVRVGEGRLGKYERAMLRIDNMEADDA